MKRVLFVCIHNAGRSQMAEAFFNQMAGGKAAAGSGGTMPGEHVHPEVVEMMREVGIDLADKQPQALTFDMVKQSDKVITMGCGADQVEAVCPAIFVPNVEDWKLDDPKGKPIERVREIRDEIKARVKELLERLEKE